MLLISKLRENPAKCALICAVFSTILVLTHVTMTWQDGDEGRIVVLAKAVAAGQGLVQIHLPTPQPNIIVPPAYPWMLGQLLRIFGDHLLPLRLLSVLCYVCFSVLVFLLILQNHSLKIDGVMGSFILGTAGVFLLSYGWRIFSEMPYLAISFGSLLCLGKSSSDKDYGLIALAGLLAGLSLLVRPVGIVLIGAGGLFLLWRRRFRMMVLFGCVALLVNVPNMWHNTQLTGFPVAYMTHYDREAGGTAAPGLGALSTMAHSLPRYFFVRLPRRMFFSLFDYRCVMCRVGLRALVPVAVTTVAALIALGFFRRWRRWNAMDIYWILYWPVMASFNQGDFAQRGIFLYQDRYLLPIIPIAAIYLCEGVEAVTGLLARTRMGYTGARRFGAAVTILLALYVLATSVAVGAIRTRNEYRLRGLHGWDPQRYMITGHYHDAAWARYVETGLWIAEHTPDDAVIVCRKSDHMYLFSGRRSFRYDGTEVTGESIWDLIRSQSTHGPLYILQDAFPPDSGYGMSRIEMLDPVIAARRDQLDLVYETPTPVTRLWRVKDSGTRNEGQ